MRLFIERSGHRGGFEFFLEDERKGVVYLATPATFMEVKEASYTQPTFIVGPRVAEDFLQSMIDQLWSMGIRPTGVKAPDAQIAAIQHHLEDMRRLVFDEREKHGA